jgi:hypothetical protein
MNKINNMKIEDIFLLIYNNEGKITIYENDYEVGMGVLE